VQLSLQGGTPGQRALAQQAYADLVASYPPTVNIPITLTVTWAADPSPDYHHEYAVTTGGTTIVLRQDLGPDDVDLFYDIFFHEVGHVVTFELMKVHPDLDDQLSEIFRTDLFFARDANASGGTWQRSANEAAAETFKDTWSPRRKWDNRTNFRLQSQEEFDAFVALYLSFGGGTGGNAPNAERDELLRSAVTVEWDFSLDAEYLAAGGPDWSQVTDGSQPRHAATFEKFPDYGFDPPEVPQYKFGNWSPPEPGAVLFPYGPTPFYETREWVHRGGIRAQVRVEWSLPNLPDGSPNSVSTLVMDGGPPTVQPVGSVVLQPPPDVQPTGVGVIWSLWLPTTVGTAEPPPGYNLPPVYNDPFADKRAIKLTLGDTEIPDAGQAISLSDKRYDQMRHMREFSFESYNGPGFYSPVTTRLPPQVGGPQNLHLISLGARARSIGRIFDAVYTAPPWPYLTGQVMLALAAPGMRRRLTPVVGS